MKRLTRSRVVRVAVFLALLALPYALLRIPAARAWVTGFVSFVRSGGPLGGVALLGFYVGWALLATPFWVMGAVAGYAYGFPLGFAVSLPATTLAMCVSFLAGRAALGRIFAPSAGDSARVVAIRRAIDADGFKITALLRMTPLLPQNAMTYVLASTPLRLRDFAAGTACGIVPFTLFYCYVGSLVDDAAALVAGDSPDLGAARWVALGGGLLGGGVALFVIARVARRALARAIDPA